jgi:hypothetical protein
VLLTERCQSLRLIVYGAYLARPNGSAVIPLVRALTTSLFLNLVSQVRILLGALTRLA